MDFRFGKTRTAIGIDVGGRSIKMAQLARDGAGWRLHAAATVAQPVPNHPPDAHVAEYLRGVMERRGFVGSDIILAAPSRQLEFDTLELPPASSGAPVEQIARMEMSRSAKLSETPFELAKWELPAPSRSNSATPAIAVALRHADADALIDPFEQAGFDVAAIDTLAWALARASAIHQTSDTITALLDIGFNASTIILVRDRTVIYQRSSPESGSAILLRAVNEQSQLTDEDADYAISRIGVAAGGAGDLEAAYQAAALRTLIIRHVDGIAAHIDAAFHYANHRYPDTPPVRLLVCGGGSAIGAVCEHLAGRLNVEARILSPAEVVKVPSLMIDRCLDGTFTAAVGLAMHGVV